jgi:hypothetical protein
MTETSSSATSDHTHYANTGKVDLTLDQVASLLPGVARLMLEISTRFSRGYQAVKAHNGKVASFQIGEGVKILRMVAVVQPRYQDAVTQFIAEQVNPLRDLMTAGEWTAMTDEVNRWHEEFAHGFLVWKVDENVPIDLDLMPPD